MASSIPVSGRSAKVAKQPQTPQVQSPWQIAGERLRRDKAAMVGLVLVGMVIIAGLAAPVLAPMDPYTQVLEFRNKPPGFSGEVVRYRLREDLPEQGLAIQSMRKVGDVINVVDHVGRTLALRQDQLIGETEDDWHNTYHYWLGTDHFRPGCVITTSVWCTDIPDCRFQRQYFVVVGRIVSGRHRRLLRRVAGDHHHAFYRYHVWVSYLAVSDRDYRGL